MDVEKTNILIVEDDNNFAEEIRQMLSLLGDVVPDLVATETDFYSLFSPGKYNAIILDLRLRSGYEGMKLLKFALSEDPTSPIIVLTGYASVETAIQSLKLGAKEYLEKKYFQMDKEAFSKEFLKKINKIIIEDKARKLFELNQRSSYPEHLIIGKNINMKRVMEFANWSSEKKISPTILIGEFGSEKFEIAEYIYKKSCARGKFLKKIIPPNDKNIYRELLGEKKKKGLIEDAKGGVLYLEEVFNLNNKAKQLLLNFLNNGYLQINGNKEQEKINAQVILSTTKIPEGIPGESNKTEKEFYYLMKTSPIVIPSLRERTEDILLISQYYLNAIQRQGKTSASDFSEDVIQIFKNYSWPGNLYELKQVVESAGLRAKIDRNKIIKPGHLPFDLHENTIDGKNTINLDLEKILAETTLRYLRLAFKKTNKGKMKAYEYLGYRKNQRGTLTNRIKDFFKIYPELKERYGDVYELFENKQGVNDE